VLQSSSALSETKLVRAGGDSLAVRVMNERAALSRKSLLTGLVALTQIRRAPGHGARRLLFAGAHMEALKLIDLGDVVEETKNAVPGGPPDDEYSDLRPDPYP
jgi:hypothetical protein